MKKTIIISELLLSTVNCFASDSLQETDVPLRKAHLNDAPDHVKVQRMMPFLSQVD